MLISDSNSITCTQYAFFFLLFGISPWTSLYSPAFKVPAVGILPDDGETPLMFEAGGEPEEAVPPTTK